VSATRHIRCPRDAARSLGLAVTGLAAVLWTSCSLVNQELPNQPPVVQVRDVDTLVVARGGHVSFTVSASDEDDDPLRYEWTALGAGRFSDSLASRTRWIAPTQIVGSSEFFLVSVTIIDSRPETEDPVESFLIEVVQRVPVLIAPRDTVISFRDPEVVLVARASDEDNDALSFAWEVLEEDGLAANQVRPRTQNADSMSTLRLLALVPGDVVLEVSAGDGADTVKAEFTVSVLAPDLPEGGTVTLSLPSVDGGTRNYEIDVYEYPNQRGVAPLLVESWFEAEALCRERDMRLCAQDEWVNACRGPESLPFSSVDDRDDLPEQFGLRYCNEIGSDLSGGDLVDPETVAPSGSFPNCTSGSGVYDQTGNAREWMQEWIGPAAGATTTEGVGRAGGQSASGTAFVRASCAFNLTFGAIQLEGDLPRPVPRAFIDSMLWAPADPAFADSARTSAVYQNYFSEPGERSGFRCCR